MRRVFIVCPRVCLIHDRRSNKKSRSTKSNGSKKNVSVGPASSAGESFLRVRDGAVPAAGVHPVSLAEVIARPKSHIVFAAVRGSVSGSERPRALVRILIAAPVVPGIEVRIGYRLFQFVGNNRRHTIRAGIAVRPGRLCFTSGRATVRIPNEGVLDVGTGDGAMSMPSTILGAEAGTRGYVSTGKHKVDGIRILRHLA